MYTRLFPSSTDIKPTEKSIQRAGLGIGSDPSSGNKLKKKKKKKTWILQAMHILPKQKATQGVY